MDWARLTAPEIVALSKQNAVVIIPVGSIEQHGPHLSVEVDSLLATEVSRRAARMAPAAQPILVAPTLAVGLAQHHLSFGGALTLDFAAFSAVLGCMVRSILISGFRKIALVNGHGGNTTALRVVVNELARSERAPIVTCTYWDAAAQEFREILETQPCLMHACEAETSLMMALAGDAVRLDKLENLTAPSFEGAQDPFESPFYRSLDMDELSTNGVLGNPMAATAAKGERLATAAATALATKLLDQRTWEKLTPATGAP
ncbi:MAG: creatininase family protein [Parvibaculaceae bacterium]